MSWLSPIISSIPLDQAQMAERSEEPQYIARLPGPPPEPPGMHLPNDPRPVAPDPPFGLPGLERSLTALTGLFSRQLEMLEQRLNQVFKTLARGIERWEKLADADDSKPHARPNAPPTAVSRDYGALIRDAAARHELDPALLTAVIRQESGFQPKVVSSAGAIGLMQLMPGTARSLGVRDPFDPAQNVEGGATLLRGLIDQYHGRLDLALAAYNAGSGAVDKYGGVPPYRETQDYVRNVLAMYRESTVS